MVSAGAAMVLYDSRVTQLGIRKLKAKFRRHNLGPEIELGGTAETSDVDMVSPSGQTDIIGSSESGTQNLASGVDSVHGSGQLEPINSPDAALAPPSSPTHQIQVPYSVETGLLLFAFFIASFVAIMVTRGVISNSPLLYRFFANIFLAGTPHLSAVNGRHYNIR
jgi:hypothetical protein